MVSVGWALSVKVREGLVDLMERETVPRVAEVDKPADDAPDKDGSDARGCGLVGGGKMVIWM